MQKKKDGYGDIDELLRYYQIAESK